MVLTIPGGGTGRLVCIPRLIPIAFPPMNPLLKHPARGRDAADMHMTPAIAHPPHGRL
eukprot:CAMPEP_0174937436 /NCGR_PEP_ID=MMETSP1355-20121228/60472_1 /TAXON_ID=464990 /ORGANISM="Hemiselmis tepida, Strain CCMP443" /LENGTH=57 /DNA_ID=CAMNT_0016184285 /DNA_START=11 /DNA_END=181 /DNA_ORIENTATION=-